MVTARLAARRVAQRALHDESGAYLLGATAPDVRIMTGQPRENTHYITLEANHPESSVENLFTANPHLHQLQGRQRAFLAGYLTHLEVDQEWIATVYRPFFGRESSYRGSLEANFMDRTLQFYMDWKERQDRDMVEAFYQDVMAADVEDAPLIPAATLLEWRGFVQRVLRNEPSWEWFSDFLQRRFKLENDLSDEQMREMAMSLPDVLESVLQYITPARLEAFKEAAVARQAAALRSYLS